MLECIAKVHIICHICTYLIWLIDSDYRFAECSFPNGGSLKTFVFMARNHVDDMKFLIFATLLKSEKS